MRPARSSRLSAPPSLAIEVDPSLPLNELTALLNATCERVEPGSVVVLRVRGLGSEPRSWPVHAGVHDVNRWERAVRRVERLEAATLFVGEGSSGGATLDLLLATDHRLATPDFVLRLPMVDGRLWPGMALHRLANELGTARARQLLWSTQLDVERTLRLGLIDEVAAPLEEAIHSSRVRLSRIAGPELAMRRQLLLEASSVSFEEALGPHLAACDRELRLQSASEPEVERPTNAERG